MPTLRLNITEFELQVHTPDDAATLVASSCGCSDTLSTDPTAYAVQDATAPAGPVTWHGVIGLEGVPTGDGRMIEDNALSWSVPIGLRYAAVDNGGHDGAQVVGRILTIERGSDGKINATGDIDMDAPLGYEAARVLKERTTNGISMDMDDVSFEVRVKGDLLSDEGFMEAMPATDEEGYVTVYEYSSDDELMVITNAGIRAATIVSIPAFEGAEVFLDNEEDDLPEPSREPALVAGSFPVDPPAAWFQDPGFTGPTPLTVTEDGQVFGHLAVWGTCHTAYSGQCVEPPHSQSGYAYFHTGALRTKEGTEIPVGSITLDTLHAGRTLNANDTIAHYEHTGKAVVDVRAGEDIYGIWVAGAMRPGVPDEKVRVLRASPLSGDWRRMGGGLELVAALAVNSPGFPVPRPQGLVASGSMYSLVASGVIEVEPEIKEAHLQGLDGEAFNEILEYVRDQKREKMAARKAKADALAASVRGSRAAALASRVG